MRDHTLSRRGPLIVVLIMMFSVLAWIQLEGSSDAAPAQSLMPQPGLMLQSDVIDYPSPAPQAWFAKYDGIDGEADSADHDKWISILSIDWAVSKSLATGQSRRRNAPQVEDLVISFEYEKAAVKVLEKSLNGSVIPELVIELLLPYGEEPPVYLKYEMKNVIITSYQVSGSAATGVPTVVVGNNFEEIKVTYTEFDEEGGSAGSVETEYKRP